MQILKINKFKTIALHIADEGISVEKSFTAFSDEQQRINTQYLYDSLVWFYQEFHSIIGVPRPIKINLDSRSVFMEYLGDLPDAVCLSFRSIIKATSFFEHCYQIQDDRGFLRNMQGSVAVTPLGQALLDSEFPLSLGFKGDLRGNLVVGEGRVILADIDSIAIEPMGLSELVLYAGLACSFEPRVLIEGVFFSLQIPVVYQYLDELQAKKINEAAVELLAMNMQGLSKRLYLFKIKRATTVLSRLTARYYSSSADRHG